MLYLHCGWPRTATTSLQTVLHRNRARLAEAGIAYPEEWLAESANSTPQGIYKVLQASREGRRKGADEFRHFLAAHEEDKVVLSAEGLTVTLLLKDKHNGLPHLLAVAQEVTPVKCVWSLRRLDEVSISIYLLRLRRRREVPPIETYLANRPVADPLFDGMRAAEDAVDGNVAYVKYEGRGAHLGELLRACDVPDPLGAEIVDELREERLNRSLTYKQATALVHRDILSARAGVELDFAALRKAFGDGGFRFAEDRRFEPVASDLRQSLHEDALGAARRHDFAPYLEFFGDVEIPPSPATPPDPDAISDEDLTRLVSHIDSTLSAAAAV